MDPRHRFSIVAALVSAVLVTASAPAEEPTCEDLRDWVPGDVIAFAQINGLAARLDAFLGSQLRKNMESTQLGRDLVANEDLEQLESYLDWFRETTGKDAFDVVKDVLGEDVVAAARLTFIGTPELIILSRAKSRAHLLAARKTLEKAVEAQAGQAPLTSKSDYRGYTLETLGTGHFAYIGSVLAVSNSKGMIERTIDLAEGESDRCISKSEIFKKVSLDPADSSLIRLAVRPRFIPGLSIPEQLDNPAASLLFGGLAEVVRVSQVMGVSLDVTDDSLALRVESIPDDRGLGEKYESFFPNVIPNDLQKRLRERDVLGFINLHRNLSQWWEHAEQLLEPRAAGDLIEFAATMSLFFGGKSFQDEVLPEIGSTLTVVARNQSYKSTEDKPNPTIPGVAVLFQLRDADKFGRSFKVAFNSIVGIINVTRMQETEDAPSMLVTPKLVGKTECYTVDMGLTPSKGKKPGIEYNFTPALAVVGDRVVLSSSFQLLEILVEELEKKTSSSKTVVKRRARDRILIDVASAVEILADNRDFFASRNMVEKGTGLKEARAEIDAGLELASLLRDLEIVSYRDERDVVHLNLRVRLAGDGEPAEPKGASPTKTAAVSK